MSQPPPTAWERALPTLRMKPMYTKSISDVFMETVAPVIQQKCKAWARDEDEYIACRRYITRRIVTKYFPYDRKTVEEIERQTGVSLSIGDLPESVRNKDTVDKARDYITKECGAIQDKRKQFACMVDKYTTAMRAVLAGGFVGSAEPTDSPYYLPPKRKTKRGEIKMEPGEKEVFEAAINIGQDIKKKCEQFANEQAKNSTEDVKKIAYTYCRLTTVNRSLAQNIPRGIEIKQKRLAKEVGLTDTYKQVEDETKTLLEGASKMYKDEMKDRVMLLKNAQATDEPIPYIATKIARRAVTSTIGNAIAKRAPYQ